MLVCVGKHSAAQERCVRALFVCAHVHVCVCVRVCVCMFVCFCVMV
jgi:hypothetical protein